MKYDASQIRLINIPQLEQVEDGQCCRKYVYRFTNLLPEQNVIDQIANSLEKRFLFSKEEYDLTEDVEICASIVIKRLQDDEAIVSVLTTQPEETCVYLFSIYTLPHKLEERFGTVKLIQGQPREAWISASKKF